MSQIWNEMMRSFYAIQMGWRYRHALQRYQKDKMLQTETVLQLAPEKLKTQGIEVLVLDLDGVITAFGEESLSQDLINWLTQCITAFGAGNVFILTNKPTKKRVQLFAALHITVIRGFRKKPYPDGLMKILEITKKPAKTILLIDDRLLTGILASEIVGIQGKWVTKPYKNLAKRPIIELFFMLLRKMEKIAF